MAVCCSVVRLRLGKYSAGLGLGRLSDLDKTQIRLGKDSANMKNIKNIVTSKIIYKHIY